MDASGKVAVASGNLEVFDSFATQIGQEVELVNSSIEFECVIAYSRVQAAALAPQYLSEATQLIVKSDEEAADAGAARDVVSSNPQPAASASDKAPASGSHEVTEPPADLP